VPSPKIEVVYEIDARVQEAVGDGALGQGEKVKALEAYRKSADHYEKALAECQRVVGLYDTALTEAKAGRKSRLITTIAANVVGGGLAAATGVGFVAVPKRVKENPIDEYAEALAQNQLMLSVVSADRTNLAAKLHSLEIDPAPATSAPKTPVPAVIATIPAGQ
jgi:hypothetical protein